MQTEDTAARIGLANDYSTCPASDIGKFAAIGAGAGYPHRADLR